MTISEQTALEVYRNKYATPAELIAELGNNWVIARRTPRIVKKYGADVNCVSAAQYAAAQLRAIAKRKGRRVMSKLQFSSSVAVKWSGRGMVSVPALPHRGCWAVTKLNPDSNHASITHIPTGEKIGDIKNLRVGRHICAVLNALPYDWQAWPKFAYEFRETVWFEWLKAVRL